MEGARTVKPSAILLANEHRLWPLPTGRWIMRQTWRELLFAHWPVPPAMLRPLLPPALTLDTFADNAWIGIVPFRMTDVRVRGCPPIPTTSRLPEINVRTYVSAGGRSGVWFLSLDAGSPLAVAVARARFYLPYFNAAMQVARQGDTIVYASRRIQRGAPAAEFRARYSPIGPPERAAPGSLADWLTARYSLFACNRAGHLFRGDVHHAPWPLAPAQLDLERNTMLAGWGIELGAEAPLLHYAETLEVLCWPVHRVA